MVTVSRWFSSESVGRWRCSNGKWQTAHNARCTLCYLRCPFAVYFKDEPAPVDSMSVNFSLATDVSGLFASSLRFHPPKRRIRFLFQLLINCAQHSEVRLWLFFTVHLCFKNVYHLLSLSSFSSPLSNFSHFYFTSIFSYFFKRFSCRHEIWGVKRI